MFTPRRGTDVTPGCIAWRMRGETAETKKLDPERAIARTMAAMRLLAVAVALLALAAVLVATLSTVHADAAQALYISGLKVSGSKPVAIVRLTNTSTYAADVFH